VNSAVVQLTPRREPLAEDARAFLRFASRCFRQKRKTLRNNLVSVYPEIREQPEAGLRAEQVPVTQLVDLFGRLCG
jgi:16S rRNA A1518/A1519 N6-dimethyltransferase RsmA/KsgA/DIM1 with predicted DNA glycosylase/AP lyase activity